MAKYLRDLLSHAPYAPTQQAEFRTWSKQFAHWLFSTDHITGRYKRGFTVVNAASPLPELPSLLPR